MEEMNVMTSRGRSTTDERTGASIRCTGLVRRFESEGIEVVALHGVDVEVEPGIMVALVGETRSGKTTLLNILAGMDLPTGGQAVVAGLDLAALTSPERIRYRRHVVGLVSQQTSEDLLPYLTAQENVALALSLRGIERSEQADRASELLTRAGLTDRADIRPARLSAAERWRAAVAVALANTPRLLLVDEPGVRLEPASGAEAMDMLAALSSELGITVVVATRDELLAELAERTMTIADGQVVQQTILARDGGTSRRP
jgi:ABC-type lipoprotein export system ATPase subunit